MSYINLSELPTAIQGPEKLARALARPDEGGYEIVLRPGCHGRPSFDPPVVGVVETCAAALALVRERTRTASGWHRRLAYRPFGSSGPGTYPEDAPSGACELSTVRLQLRDRMFELPARDGRDKRVLLLGAERRRELRLDDPGLERWLQEQVPQGWTLDDEDDGALVLRPWVAGP